MYVYCVVVREKGNVDGCADKLVQESVDRGSTDNGNSDRFKPCEFMGACFFCFLTNTANGTTE